MTPSALERFGGHVACSAGVEVGADFGFPAGEGARQTFDFRDGATAALVQQYLQGMFPVAVRDVVDQPKFLIAVPTDRDITLRVTGFQTCVQGRDLLFGEMFGALEQGPADPEQRVVLAAAVAQGPVLHAAADVIEHAAAQLDVERLQNRHSLSPRMFLAWHGGLLLRGEPIWMVLAVNVPGIHGVRARNYLCRQLRTYQSQERKTAWPRTQADPISRSSPSLR